MLDPAGRRPAIDDTPNQRPNPLVELASPASDVVEGVDLCIVTHLHQDHFDGTAAETLPSDLPILTQPESAATLTARRFTNGSTSHDAIAMPRGRHGTVELTAALVPESRCVVDGAYIASDT